MSLKRAALPVVILCLGSCAVPAKETKTGIPSGVHYYPGHSIYALENVPAQDALASLTLFLENSGLWEKMTEGSAYDDFRFLVDEESNSLLYMTPKGKEDVIKSVLQSIDEAGAAESVDQAGD